MVRATGGSEDLQQKGASETRFVCEDFHRVQNPRLMTDDYFESVVEIYDELAEKGPKP